MSCPKTDRQRALLFSATWDGMGKIPLWDGEEPLDVMVSVAEMERADLLLDVILLRVLKRKPCEVSDLIIAARSLFVSGLRFVWTRSNM